ncbi:MAG: FHA domain-containing protein [Polyangiales bacterium]
MGAGRAVDNDDTQVDEKLGDLSAEPTTTRAYNLVITDDEQQSTVLPVLQDELTIGRKEGNTVQLTERNVSRRHARLQPHAQGFVVEDLGSYNGVLVNGERIQGRAAVQAGDILRIGDYTLKLQERRSQSAEHTAPTTTSPEAESRGVAPPPSNPSTWVSTPARLVMLSSPTPGAEFALTERRMTVGRTDALELWVNHRSISREHAQIVRDGDRFRIIDLDSANGTRVNGKEQSSALLHPGDVVELGQVTFRYVEADQVYDFASDKVARSLARGGRPQRSRLTTWLVVLALLFAIGVPTLVALSTRLDSLAWVQSSWAQVRSWLGQRRRRSSPKPRSAPPGAGAAVQEEDEVLQRERLEAHVRRCQQALATGKLALATEEGSRALHLDPEHDAALTCTRAAERAHTEQQSYERGRAAAAAGDIDAAYLAFEELPSDSARRQDPVVVEAMLRYAKTHVASARQLLRTHPDDAARHASMVLAMLHPPPAQGQEAKRIQRRVLRRTGRHTRARDPRGNKPAGATSKPATATAPATGGGSPSPSGTCTPGSADYHECIIRTLEGSAASANQLALLIDSYRQTGQRAKAERHMRDFIGRFPGHRLSAIYEQALTDSNPSP